MSDENYSVHPLTYDIACEIAARVLPLDWEECEVATGNHPGDCLKAVVETNQFAFAVVRNKDDEALAAIGAYPIDKKSFGVWMLVTDAVTVADGVFARKQLPVMLKTLGNLVGCRDGVPHCLAWEGNTVHMRWLHSAGWRPTGLKQPTSTDKPLKELSYVPTTHSVG